MQVLDVRSNQLQPVTDHKLKELVAAKPQAAGVPGVEATPAVGVSTDVPAAELQSLLDIKTGGWLAAVCTSSCSML